MATQYGVLRKYTSVYEGVPPMEATQCPQCFVKAVPRDSVSTVYGSREPKNADSCPNCGHIYGRNSLIDTKVKGIVVKVEGDGEPSITTKDGTLQLVAEVSPFYAENKEVTWSIENDTGEATIDNNGLVTAVSNGSVIAKATATDGSGVEGVLTITITGQLVLVENITIEGSDSIDVDGGTAQMVAIVSPPDATNPTVEWSIENETGEATIDNNGLVTAIRNGTVVVKATATDGSNVTAQKQLTISNQTVLVESITIEGPDTIDVDGGTAQMTAVISPPDATNQTVTWSIINNTGEATIDQNGLVTAVRDGVVTVIAAANDGSGVTGQKEITISNQEE